MKKSLLTALTFVASIVIYFMFVAVYSVLASVPVFFLWNWLMPDLFGLPTVTFWQALGLSLLCSCLFCKTASKKETKETSKH